MGGGGSGLPVPSDWEMWRQPPSANMHRCEQEGGAGSARQVARSPERQDASPGCREGVGAGGAGGAGGQAT